MDNSFIIIPKELFTSEKYKNLSADAKLLYGIVRDRNSLSQKNNWQDENGETFIVLSLDFVCEMINCKVDKAQKTIKELIKVGLIKKIKKGFHCPCLYSVVNLYTEKSYIEDNNTEKPYSNIRKNRNIKYDKIVSNNTEYNKTEFSNTFFYEKEEIENEFKAMIDYDILIETENKDILDNIIGVVVDLFKSCEKTVKIGGIEYDRQFAFERFMSLNSGHIEYVVELLDNNDKPIKNMRQYLLTLLFNSKNTIDAYYTHRVKADMKKKFNPRL